MTSAVKSETVLDDNTLTTPAIAVIPATSAMSIGAMIAVFTLLRMMQPLSRLASFLPYAYALVVALGDNITILQRISKFFCDSRHITVTFYKKLLRLAAFA
jgi:hypothetical protein